MQNKIITLLDADMEDSPEEELPDLIGEITSEELEENPEDYFEVLYRYWTKKRAGKLLAICFKKMAEKEEDPEIKRTLQVKSFWLEEVTREDPLIEWQKNFKRK